MTDKQDFIEREILPVLGGFEKYFDIEGICDEVTDFDPAKGYVWRDEFVADGSGENISRFNSVLQAHDLTVMSV